MIDINTIPDHSLIYTKKSESVFVVHTYEGKDPMRKGQRYMRQLSTGWQNSRSVREAYAQYACDACYEAYLETLDLPLGSTYKDNSPLKEDHFRDEELYLLDEPATNRNRLIHTGSLWIDDDTHKKIRIENIVIDPKDERLKIIFSGLGGQLFTIREVIDFEGRFVNLNDIAFRED